MTKVEIDDKTYCVETLIYEVERLTKEVKASAEHHKLVLDQMRAEIDSAKMPKNRMSFFRDGIDCALQIIDKYRGESEGV